MASDSACCSPPRLRPVVRNTRLALDATFSEGAFFGSRSTTATGWEVVFEHTRNELGGLFQNVETRNLGVTTFGVYVEPDLPLTSAIRSWRACVCSGTASARCRTYIGTFTLARKNQLPFVPSLGMMGAFK